MDPPPRDPSTGAKGSALLRLARRVIFAAQPRAGAEAARTAKRTMMTAHRDLKRIIHERQKKTGESYTTARVHVMRERAALLGLETDAPAPEPVRVDAVVLKVNQHSVRVRTLDEDSQVTFRSGDVWDAAPGHLVTLVTERRWTWRGDA